MEDTLIKESKTVQILDSLTARKIAAGEVVERPACIVRELIDNSIDAGAFQIEINIQNGGLDLIQVSDNGKGMSKEDLTLCYKSHATSKIQKIDDLSQIISMGFRGEALPSITSISRTNIISFDQNRNEAYKICIEGDDVSKTTQATRSQGTDIKVEKIFHSIPVRKRFLTNSTSEKNKIKQVVTQKAIAFENIGFVLKENKKIVLEYPRESAWKRSVRICSEKNMNMYLWRDTIAWTENNLNYKLSAALGMPEIAIRTRKHIHIYVNKRPIKSFELLQAVEYAYKDVLHAGLVPQAVLFLEIPPSELDVNIHPTKQEIRIRNISKIRSHIIKTICNTLQPHTNQSMPFTPKNNKTSVFPHKSNYKDTSVPVKHNQVQNMYHKKHENKTDFLGLPDIVGDKKDTSEHSFDAMQHHSKQSSFIINEDAQYQKSSTIKTTSATATQTIHIENVAFIGCTFSTYLIFEHKEELLLLDFHATDERQIFDMFKKNPKPHTLLLPIELSLSVQESDVLHVLEQYKKIGILIEIDSEKKYQLTAVPQVVEDSAPKIAQAIEENINSDSLDVILFASKACRKATKAGDHVDKQSAFDFLQYAISLSPPRCPHGRPLWITIEKKQLDSLIGRLS